MGPTPFKKRRIGIGTNTYIADLKKNCTTFNAHNIDNTYP